MAIAPPSPQELAAFRSLQSVQQIAFFFGTSRKRLIFHLYASARPQYRVFRIPKMSGGYRQIASPPPLIGGFQRQLLRCMTACASARDPVHGFTANRSVVTNAGKHLGAKLILNVDIQDFFPTFHFGRIRGVFAAHPFSFPLSVATILAQVCCFRGYLPQGAATSPILSNLICRGLDRDLSRLAINNHCLYTRYADDITFSTERESFPIFLVARLPTLQDPRPMLGDELLAIFAKHTLTVNPKKLRLRRKSNRQEVTGITINEKLNVTRAFVRNIRSILHDCETRGQAKANQKFIQVDRKARRGSRPTVIKHVRGKLDYLKMVRGADDSLYVRYEIRAEKIAARKNYGVPIFGRCSKNNEILGEAVWVILGFDPDDLEVVQGTGFTLENVGIITARHVIDAGRNNGARRWAVLNAANPKRQYAIRGYRSDPCIDIAVLSTIAPLRANFRPAISVPKVGDCAFIVGFPHWNTTADQMLVAPSNIIQTKSASAILYLLTGGPVRGGNSGGPFLSHEGYVTGIALWDNNSLIAPDGGVSINHVQLAQDAPLRSLP